MPFDESVFGKIPDAESLEKRFSFITDENLRQNLTVCFQYVIFLTIISASYNRGGAIELSLYRDIVVHTASVVESCIHYGITRLKRSGKIEDSKFPTEWKPKNLTDIYKISATKKIVWGFKEKVPKVLGENPMSKDINHTAKAVGLLDSVLYSKAESLRELRNNIHINGEKKIVTYPSKSDIDQVFLDAKAIINHIELQLS